MIEAGFHGIGIPPVGIPQAGIQQSGFNESAFNQSVLDFDLDVSVTLSALYFLLYSAATFAVFLSGLPLYAKIIAGILIAVSLAFRLYRYVLLRHPRSVVAIDYREPSWFLRLRSGEEVHAKVSG